MSGYDRYPTKREHDFDTYSSYERQQSRPAPQEPLFCAYHGSHATHTSSRCADLKALKTSLDSKIQAKDIPEAFDHQVKTVNLLNAQFVSLPR